MLALVVPASWLPALALQSSTGTQVPIRLLPQAVAGSLLAAVAVLTLTGRLRLRRPPSGVAVAVLLLLAVAVPVAGARPARAHDPGQGATVGTAHLAVTRTGGTVELVARVDQPCQVAGGGTAGVVGRRGGETVRAPATSIDPGGSACTYAGTLSLPASGRWFVYLELRGPAGRRYETWIALAAGSTAASATRELYRPPPPASGAGRAVAGAALYLIVVGLLIGSARLAAPSREVAA